MLSRVAESLYWMARYVERAENIARLINVNTHLLLDLPRGISPGWQPLIAISGGDAQFNEHHSDYSQSNAVRFLVADESYPGSIVSSLGYARENARTIRDYIPREAWEQVNNLFLELKQGLPAGLAQRRRYQFLNNIVAGIQQLTGLLAGTLNHDCGYRFLRCGRNLERADMTARILKVRCSSLLPEQMELTPFENIQWMSVLYSLTAYQMYRRRMQARVRRAQVLRFLLQETVFPRSYHHCLTSVESDLIRLPRNDAALRSTLRARRLVQEADTQKLSGSSLATLLEALQGAAAQIHCAIEETYFLPVTEALASHAANEQYSPAPSEQYKSAASEQTSHAASEQYSPTTKARNKPAADQPS